MFEYLFTFRALTPAQNARGVLHTNAIEAQLARAPKQISQKGCGYVLRVSSSAGLRALSVLRAQHQSFMHLYRVFRSGKIEEVRV